MPERYSEALVLIAFDTRAPRQVQRQERGPSLQQGLGGPATGGLTALATVVLKDADGPHSAHSGRCSKLKSQSGALAAIAREVALDIAGRNYSIGELEHIPGRRVEPFVGPACPCHSLL